MGHGAYSSVNSVSRSITNDYSNKSNHEIFVNRQVINEMSPHGLRVRESRDSDEHPNSIAIILGLDVTGSMGSVPHFLVREGLNHSVSNIIQGGEPDPQVCFVAVGDHECDRSPLQIGQFESSDELLDKWLTSVFMEGGGGGNAGESYLLAWYFAAMHTSIDCFEKRGNKGFVFTIGDEPTLLDLPASAIRGLIDNGQQSYSAQQLYDLASERYHVFHIHLKETGTGRRQGTIEGWKQLIGENCLVAEKATDISKIITDKVLQFADFTEGSNSAAATEEASNDEDML